jgi:SsrA-binding protein
MAKKEEGAPGVKLIARNKHAYFQYEILQKIECGLALVGTEVKSLREGNVNFADSYARVQDGKLVLVGLNIAEYKMGNRFNHVAARTRTLLARKPEIRKLAAAVEQRGLTLAPLAVYWKRGWAKVEIGVARGKQLHDKRDTIRRRELDREKGRAIRAYGR